MTDLVKRLRERETRKEFDDWGIMDEAADRIEALEAEVARLREALTRIDRLTEEAPFDFGLIRLIARQSPDATEALNRVECEA